MELDRETRTGVNISTEAEVLNFVNSGSAREIVARIKLGTVAQPIAGNGSYTIRIYVDGIRSVPESPITVPAGVTQAIAVSRPVMIDEDEVVSVRVLGVAGDTAVTLTTILRDATAVTQTDLLGEGPTQVDHNYGGADNLSYKTSGNVGIVGADVRIYTTEDYDAGNTANENIVARTTTTVGGRWSRPVMLESGSYTLVYYKQSPGGYGPDTTTITVA